MLFLLSENKNTNSIERFERIPYDLIKNYSKLNKWSQYSM